MAEEKVAKVKKVETNLAKIAITREAEESLLEIMEKVNNEYQGGRATRLSVASWVLTEFAKKLSPVDVKQMRIEFLNEFSLLDLILKKSKEKGQLSPELKQILMQQVGLLENVDKKAHKKKSQDEVA